MKIRYTLIMLTMLALGITVAACQPTPPPPTTPPEKPKTSTPKAKHGSFPAGKRFPETGSDSYISFSKNTTVEPAVDKIGVTPSPPNVPPLPTGEKAITTVDVKPDELTFRPPADLTFRLPPDHPFKPGQKDVPIKQYDNKNKKWADAGFADVEDEPTPEFATGQIAHTTLFALVEKVAGAPAPTAEPVVSVPAPPASVERVDDYTISWSASPGATYYLVVYPECTGEMYTDKSYIPVEVTETIFQFEVTTCIGGPPSGGVYEEAGVRACNNDGCSDPAKWD